MPTAAYVSYLNAFHSVDADSRIAAPSSIFSELSQHFKAKWQETKTRAELERMSDHQLCDLGLRRQDIASVIRKAVANPQIDYRTFLPSTAA